MRTSTPFGSVLSAGAILALLAGCAGAGSGGSSTFTPLSQTSNAQHQSIVKLDSQFCPAYNANRLFVPLKTSNTFAVLGASTVTSTGLTLLNGDLGLSPGTSITGFPPGIVNGSIDAGTPVAAQAQMDMTRAYNHIVAMKNPTLLPADIGGTTIAPGLYDAPTTLGITGTVTLDGQNHADSYFVFQIPSTLTTSVDSSVTLTNKANACNIFWQVGSSATLNTASVFNGTILAAASISVGTGSAVTGRLLAGSGAVTLLDDAVSTPPGGEGSPTQHHSRLKN
jgi:hypothetical protein